MKTGRPKPGPRAPTADEDGPFFHVSIKSGDTAKEEKNIGASSIFERVAVPHRLNKPYRIDGFEFQPARVTRLRITRTSAAINPAELIRQLDTSSLSALVLTMASVGQKMSEGEDVTDDLLKQADQVIAERGLTPTKKGTFDDVLQPDKAFVVMSFDPDLEESFEAISKACRAAGVNAIRADNEISSAPVMDRVILHLREASYVIVDLTNARPNVYYEVGYFDAVCAARGVDPARHLLLVASNIAADAHFDVKHRGIEEYRNPFALMKRVEAWLQVVRATSDRNL